MQRNSSSFNAGTRMTAWFAAVLAIACVGLSSTHADQINYVMVPVGNAGNTADTNTGGLYGAVSYNYQIGAYDVTGPQYTAFLNAVGSTDTYGLYNSDMGTNIDIA